MEQHDDILIYSKFILGRRMNREAFKRTSKKKKKCFRVSAYTSKNFKGVRYTDHIFEGTRKQARKLKNLNKPARPSVKYRILVTPK